MLNAEWFADPRVRCTECINVTLGYYGITSDAMQHEVKYRKSASKVLARLLAVCSVDSAVVEERTGWNPQIVKHDLRVPSARDPNRLNPQEHQTVSILLRHVMTTVERDEGLPEDPEHMDPKDKRWLLKDAFRNLHESFLRTALGQKWYLRYSRFTSHASSYFDLVREKPGDADKLKRECLSENARNDELIWRAVRDFVEPVEWQGPYVLLARGYKMALELSPEDARVFEADGRVVLLRGKSAYLGSKPAPHCLVFPTSFEARSFLRARTRGWRRYAA